MPKAARSPAKSPAKPRAPRSPKKAPTSKLFLDDEADASDGELNLQYPESDSEFPSTLLPAATFSSNPAPTEEEQYDADFINDGDPYDNASVNSDHITPPPPRPRPRPVRKSAVVSDSEQAPSSTRVKSQARSPRKAPVASDSDNDGRTNKRVAIHKSAEPVIELTSSEEDLEALADDDSMFRKPSGVKAAALPVPLKTRSSAKRSLPSDDNDAVFPATSPVKKIKSASRPTSDTASEMTKFMGEFMTAFMAEKFPGLTAGSSAAAPTSSPARAKGKGASSSQRSKAAGPVRSFSPDWEGPYGGDGPSTPSPAGKSVTSKGKGRAVSSPSKQNAHHRVTSDDPSVDVKSEVDKFMPSPGKSDKPLTIAEYFESEMPPDTSSQTEPVDDEASTVFLEDLETYRANYNPSARCGVFDLDLQDLSLRPTYRGLPPLPSMRQLLPVYDANRNAGIEPVKGGRVKFQIWSSYIPDMLADNSRGALLFEQAAPSFINPSRVSPVRLSSRISTGSTTTYRLHFDDRIAVCVSALFCADSKIVAPVKIGGRSDRLRKWLAGIFHNQDWERFEALICLVFGEHIMRAQISAKNAVSFQTIMSPVGGTSSAKDANNMFDTDAPAGMFTPVKSTTPSKVPSSPSKFSSARGKTLLDFNDRVPVYDARKVVVDFNSDLTRLDDVLPPFVGEIPFGSFVVVGYTCSMYHTTIPGSSERLPHLGCNILWVVVCGVPKVKR